jgi:hypothetical protein
MEGLSLTFKQGTKQDYMIQKQQHKIKNKKTRCAKQMWKRIFIMLTYANMNMKRTWQGYGARSCLKLMLNKPKKMKGPIFIYTFFWEFF